MMVVIIDARVALVHAYVGESRHNHRDSNYWCNMPIQTTCIGAYPKPDHLIDGQWEETDDEPVARGFTYASHEPGAATDEQLDEATRQAIADQVECGIDIPTDGEQRRENYIHYHCRHLNGIDFQNLTRKVHRNGAAVADLPSITGKIEPIGDHFLDADYRMAQSCTDRPVKITVPGPVTIIDTTADLHYNDDRKLAFDLAVAINFEVRALAAAGCTYIQVDEPLFARNVDAALDYGVECLERCFDGVPESVTRTMHMCCGYPGHLDDDDYEKADPGTYQSLASALDSSTIDAISIEDAHRHNDFSLFEQFRKSTVILGCIAIASSRVAETDEIAQRIQDALRYIDADRLMAAPDCGLMMLDRELAMTKLKAMCEAARTL